MLWRDAEHTECVASLFKLNHQPGNCRLSRFKDGRRLKDVELAGAAALILCLRDLELFVLLADIGTGDGCELLGGADADAGRGDDRREA